MRMKRKEGRKEGKKNKKYEGRHPFIFSLSCYKFVKNLKEEKLLSPASLFSPQKRDSLRTRNFTSTKSENLFTNLFPSPG